MQIEILALRHQLAVLQRRTNKRLSLRTADRLLWVVLSRVWAQWRSALVIVKPETVIAWQRKGFRLYWRWKSRAGKSGRPCVSHEVRELIRQIEHRKSPVGSTKDSWRIAETRNKDLSGDGSEVYGASAKAAVTNVAHVS
jgi:putative transposase